MRKLLVEDLQLGVSPSDIQVVDSGRVIEVLWSDGHLATYPATWLHQRAFNTHKRDLRNNTVRSKPTLWGKELLENLPRASFPELLQDDSALLQFLQQLESHGLVVVSDTPTKLGQLHRLSDRVAYLSRSHYGETFIVESKNDPINLAYTAAKLEMHSDIPSRKYKPCIQMLHCIRQFHGEGGDNQLTDGFQVSHNFRTLHPDKFHILATTPVDFIDIGVEDGRDFFLVNHDPMIRLDINGQIQSVNFNQFSRDSYFRVPVEEVAGWYDAMKTFRDMVNDNQYCIEYKMKDGDILVFDNFRLLHGRKAYTIEGERVLEGGYWEWDDVLSRRRVLQAKLSNE
ncbi:Gamma-butyrobetaine dioxygenase-like 4 [Homarus americanus]|uniref:Gamma-butyrobetaine dioxygenase-like 4 n=2 Tax=Homarus americanus TaxID=6706 RepID=A0A8J5MZN2_HOMAM|nr:Gamma-butyrobetaine dioxygenase-like 4 [Homarus americanus]